MPDPRERYLAWSMARSAVYTAHGAVMANRLERDVYLEACDIEQTARQEMDNVQVGD